MPVVPRKHLEGKKNPGFKIAIRMLIRMKTYVPPYSTEIGPQHLYPTGPFLKKVVNLQNINFKMNL